MGWAMVVRDTETGVARLIVDPKKEKPLDLDRVERHSIPCYEQGEWILFGIHQPTKNCICQPSVIEDGFGYEIILHKNRKPN
jgi:hypothetical protein